MNANSEGITCPNCGTEIPLTETIAAPFIERAKKGYEAQIGQAMSDKLAAEQKLSEGQAKLAVERTQIEAQVADQLSKKLAEAEKAQRTKIRGELELEIKGAKEREEEVIGQLKKLQEEHQGALKGKQQAELAAGAAKIEAQREVQAELAKLKEEAKKDAQEAEHLKIAEKDKQIEKLLSQLDEAKRQAQQGSQQMQGEVLELDFEETLRQTFPWDEIEPVKTGQRGGDILQRVMSGPGLAAGTIMWEIKRTQNWSGDWPAKARHDAANVKAEIVIIFSEATPKGIDTFGFFEGVWVCKALYAIALAHAMRQQIDQVAAARRAAAGKQGKAELLYDYLIGPEFRARLEGIVEPFLQMQRDLEGEKRATLARWKKRERQIDRVLVSASSLAGDLQGIGGQEMPELPAFADAPETDGAEDV